VSLCKSGLQGEKEKDQEMWAVLMVKWRAALNHRLCLETCPGILIIRLRWREQKAA